MQVEMGSKNHEIVAVKMINQLGGLRSTSRTERCISELAKVKCISKIRNAKCKYIWDYTFQSLTPCR